jgi:hypothetical protein
MCAAGSRGTATGNGVPSCKSPPVGGLRRRSSLRRYLELERQLPCLYGIGKTKHLQVARNARGRLARGPAVSQGFVAAKRVRISIGS